MRGGSPIMMGACKALVTEIAKRNLIINSYQQNLVSNDSLTKTKTLFSKAL